jgi:nucleotide-binding universal stress UspA family protein
MKRAAPVTEEREAPLTPDPSDLSAVYRSILVAVDSSDHSDRATEVAAALAGLYGAQVTGVHVYAAKLHDLRFRQMEGGLPEQYRQEQELERQRDVHDDLITRGLSIITDSYLDQAEKACLRQGVRFARRSLEGKNYRELVREANGGGYDLLVLGSRGLGAIEGNHLGTVCRRAARRSAIDTLIIKEPKRRLSEGPIVVAVDGSDRAYGGLLTALTLARHWKVPVEVVAAYDPHYHTVAFNRIAGVLSEKASKVFRFKEQEKLHEEIIDSGIARIYESHLKMSETVARDLGAEVTTVLLEGKPHHVIEEHVRRAKASLLVVGKLGIHADDGLDIGGNAESLLHGAPCAVLLSERTYRPPLDEVAELTMSWTKEAEGMMEAVPQMVRKMARMGILRYAQERGHTVITGKIVKEVTELMCPVRPEKRASETPAASEPAREAQGAADSLPAPALADKPPVAPRARAEGGERTTQPTDPSTAEQTGPIRWSVEALARLARVPAGFMRDATRQRIEDYALNVGAGEVTLEVAEHRIAQAKQAMRDGLRDNAARADPHGVPGLSGEDAEPPIPWTDEAEQALLRVPEGFMRNLTRQRVEAFAGRQGKAQVTTEVMDAKYAEWGEGSAGQRCELPWDDDALEQVGRIPEFVRRMVIKEVESCARRMGVEAVSMKVLDSARRSWQEHGVFHAEDNPQQDSD